MQRRQALVAAIAAVTVGYLTLPIDTTTAAASATITFFAVLWVWATIGRVRYWRPRGGYQTEHCPNCNAGRKRLGGDWTLECKTCGWKAGWPLVRHLTHGVIGVQAHRSISRRGAFLVGVAVALLAAGGPETPGTPSAPNSPSAPSLGFLDQLGTLVQQAVIGLAGLAVLALIVYIAMQPPKKWCENCGFAVGRDPPSRCPNCGFNVFVKEKPPAGGMKNVKVHKPKN